MSTLNGQNSYMNLYNNAFWQDIEEFDLRALGIQLH